MTLREGIEQLEQWAQVFRSTGRAFRTTGRTELALMNEAMAQAYEGAAALMRDVEESQK